MNRELHDGRTDGLVPLESLNLSSVDSFADLLQAMSKTAFAGRQLGEAFDILCEVARNEPCKVVLTLSGAMTVAKQGRIFCDLLDRGLIHAIVATGALMVHGLTESIGLTHYRHDPSQSDEQLFARGYNRVYDTLEMEANLNGVERLVRNVLAHDEPAGGTWWSAEFCRAVGRRLSEKNEGPGILRSTFERNVPVFIPAFTDSEIGLDFAVWAIKQQIRQQSENPESFEPDQLFRSCPPFNPFLDLNEYARLFATTSEWGILTIGGGVPRNWAQQVGPLFDISNERVGTELKPARFRYGVRVCPEPVHWGGLSGCSYSEGVSWGKFVPRTEGGRYAEVHADATAVLPLLARGWMEVVDAEKSESQSPRGPSPQRGRQP